MIEAKGAGIDKVLDDPQVLYVYSISQDLYHDKDCGRFEGEDIQLLSEFPSGGRWCKYCYRKALIRTGVGNSKKKIKICMKFFDAITAQGNDLETLFIEHKAKIEWCDDYTMQLCVKEDTWQIRRGISKANELWHNSYIVLEDGSREFTGNFHKQGIINGLIFHNMTQIMSKYAWEKGCPHKTLETLKREEKKKAIAAQLEYEANRREFKRILGIICGSNMKKADKETAILFLSERFNDAQIKEILKGAKHGLSVGQIMVYAKKEFVPKQMREIRRGLEWSISIKQVKTYAATEFSAKEMKKRKIQILKTKSPEFFILLLKERVLLFLDSKKVLENLWCSRQNVH